MCIGISLEQLIRPVGLSDSKGLGWGLAFLASSLAILMVLQGGPP